jgi:glutamate synthase (NADPH) small chain
VGKITGFMEYARIESSYSSVTERLGHYKEFTIALTDAQNQQQAARCMDCGTPFCINGCPVNNTIPDFNDLVYQAQWMSALDVLHRTNNFPEFTGRVCPAPCESACTLNINSEAVGIKTLEYAIIEKGWENDWIKPKIAKQQTNKRIAIVGSGPSGLAAAQQLARSGHSVTVFEKNDRIGGLLRYGIPEFKLEKSRIDRRLVQMQQEGVIFETGVLIGDWPNESKVVNLSNRTISVSSLRKEFDAVLLACGSEQSRDLPVPGRALDGIHFAMEFLSEQNQSDAGDAIKNQICAHGKHVIVIGGGDTGSDCVGTSRRQGALSVTQFELMPMPPEEENKPMTWPYWPIKLRTSSSHEEGCDRIFAISTKEFIGANGRVQALKTVQIKWVNGKPEEIPGSEKELPADLVFLAMGFVHPVASILDAFGVEKDVRGTAKATDSGALGYQTNVAGVFAAGDVRRGQSLVVWAIREGRQSAAAIDDFLVSSDDLCAG